jgi:hypothetical protein
MIIAPAHHRMFTQNGQHMQKQIAEIHCIQGQQAVPDTGFIELAQPAIGKITCLSQRYLVPVRQASIFKPALDNACQESALASVSESICIGIQ